MLTGDIRIDALVEASRASLAANHKAGTGAVITFSFLSSAPAGSGVYDFRVLTEGQQAAVKAMLAELSSQIGITFQQVPNGGLLKYGSYTGRDGLPSGPDQKAESITSQSGSIVWLNWQVNEIANLGSGYGRQLVLHETAHTLGLKHPEAYSGYDSDPFLPTGAATANHTIMAYNGGNTEHLGDYDLLALNYLWGAAGASPDQANSIPVAPGSATGSYFDDTFTLDVSTLTSSIRVTGLTGIDQLTINTDSNRAVIKSGLIQIDYAKSDGSFVGIFLDGVERIKFSDKSIAVDIDGNAGQAYRLYKAAFDRAPDKVGLGFWIGQLDKGSSIDNVAAGFVASQEFQAINGVSPSNQQLVTSLYQHILGRAPDQSGLNFWTKQLESGALDKSHLLINFSESNENKIALTGVVEHGIEYVA